jgi:hypothetical protein
MTQPQVALGRNDRWWLPGLLSSVLLPVWCMGFLVVNMVATFAKFGDTGCDDGSGNCMGPGPGAKDEVLVILGAAALTSLASWLPGRRRRLRPLQWSLAAASLLLGLSVLQIAATTPSH